MGGGQFQGGSVGGVSDPALAQPGVAGAGPAAPLNPMRLPAGSAQPMNGMNAPTANPSPTLTQQQSAGPSALSYYATKAGKVANALTPLLNAMPGAQQQPSGPHSQPVNFSVRQQPFIQAPVTQGGQYGQNNPYAMSNAFFGG